MARKLHDQGLVITCKGATDPGSGVERYIVYALRANNKGASAPGDTAANFADAIEISQLGNLDHVTSWRSGADPQIRAYDPLNEYRFKWYRWEDGYSYRIWTFAYDFAGNLEDYDGTGNTIATSVLVDSRPPQLALYLSGTKIPFNAYRKSSVIPWSATKAGSSLVFVIQPETPDAEYPRWHTSPGGVNALQGHWLVFYSADDGSPDYVYFARVSANSDGGSGQDNVTIYCDSNNPVYQLNVSTRKMVAITAIANVVDDAPVEWSAGRVVVLGRPLLTCGIGTMAVEWTGVAPEVADIDHYKVERYVTNERLPANPNDFDYIELISIEDAKFTDYNLVWDKDARVANWVAGSSQFTDDKVYPRGLYMITPVDIYGNEGYPVITYDYTSGGAPADKTGFFPVTGTPPANIDALVTTSDDDGNIAVEWNDPADDDLKGFQVGRRRGELVLDDSGNGTGSTDLLTDGSKSWTLDEHNGKTLVDAENNEFVITDTTATTLVVSGTPSSGYYRIYQDSAVAASYTWNSWEVITEDDYGNFPAGGGYDRLHADRNLEPFSTLNRPDRVAYQYRIRATDYSGNTSVSWVGHTTTVVKAVDTTVSTTGATLAATGNLGSITLEVTPPSDGKSRRVHIYRSLLNNTSYNDEPFKVVEMPMEAGNLMTQDEYPEPTDELLIYYRLRFEDEWGNLSGYVAEQSATSIIPSEAIEIDVQPPGDLDPDVDEIDVPLPPKRDVLLLDEEGVYLDDTGEEVDVQEKYFTHDKYSKLLLVR